MLTNKDLTDASKQLAASLQIELTNEVSLLVCDGSGNKADKPYGWGATLYIHKNNFAEVFSGGGLAGTNNYAELVPVLEVLKYHKFTLKENACQFEIISDSLLTVKQGNGHYAISYNDKRRSLWNMIANYREAGYALRWHHVPRNSNPLSEFCDKLSKQEREKFK